MKGVIFTSRNKDNENITNFKQRSMSFLTNKSVEELSLKFVAFVNEGVLNELSRFYININERNNEKAIKDLQHYLLDRPDFLATKIEAKVTSFAMRPENAITHKWLFDYDSKTGIENFVQDLVSEGFNKKDIEVYKTVNNYSIVVPHGFDARNIMEKYGKYVELKRDGLLCVKWSKKE